MTGDDVVTDQMLIAGITHVNRGRDVPDAAEAHRRIYQSIRGRDPERARRAMNEHLLQAARYQALELAKQRPAGDTRAPRRRAR